VTARTSPPGNPAHNHFLMLRSSQLRTRKFLTRPPAIIVNHKINNFQMIIHSPSFGAIF
jgi:hypothetical protein